MLQVDAHAGAVGFAAAQRALAVGVSRRVSRPAISAVPATRMWSPRREMATLAPSSSRLTMLAASGFFRRMVAE